MMCRVQEERVDAANLTTKRRYVLRFLVLVISVLSVLTLNFLSVSAQEPTEWLPQQNVPGYEGETLTPYLIADQNGVVHAFASQQAGDGDMEIAIFYNQWTLEDGWTVPRTVNCRDIPIVRSVPVLDHFRVGRTKSVSRW